MPVVVVPAGATTRVVVEIDPRAEAHVDPRLTRRLTTLEAGEVEVPAPPGARWRPVLFVRVVPTRDPAVLRVELWDHGEYHGARTVSTSSEARARRVALAAGELATRLRQRRLAQQAAAAERERVAAAQAEERRTALDQRPTQLRAHLTGAWVGGGDLALVGPGLAARTRLGGPLRLELGASGLVGGAEGAASGRWLELSLTPSVALRPTRRLTLDLGASLAAAAVHLDGVAAVDDVGGQRDTWSARAGGRAALAGRLGPWLGWVAATELGAVLRPLPLTAVDGERARLGGLWLGGSVGLHVE